jgi:hypothetical protein
LEIGDRRLTEQDGYRLLEGIYIEPNTDYVCSCDDLGVYYQTETGQFVPIITTPINTENYEAG